MEINKNTLSRMLSMDNTELWRTIRLIASTSGINLKDTQASAEDMAKIRTALSSVSGDDIKRALEILENYKK